MTDVTNEAVEEPASAGAGGQEAPGASVAAAAPLANISSWLDALRSHQDLGVALSVLVILVVLILPMPSWLLDMSLSVSITFSVLVLMTSLFIKRPLEFSAFPTVLLIATMLRLSLNLASTRLILAEGHMGTGAAGRVIEAFGNFVMSGNFVIGIIVFAILVTVNFVVITKGSGRIAEVAARFNLDAMPGKQMAIDADLSAGLINEKEAKERRRLLEDENAFFGAMDGASKFVRGDAIAGLIITVINIVGGIIVGVAQKGLSFSEASESYTLLTVGDGLVTQIPALVVSTAAGLLVSKTGSSGTSESALVGQLGSYPQALGVTSALLATMAFLPGIPMVPFLALSGAMGYVGWSVSQRRATADRERVVQEEAEAQQAETDKEEPISSALSIDHLRLELGYGLLSLINDEAGYKLTDQIRALRRQLAQDMGFVMPSVRILDNMQLQPHGYVVRVKEVEAGAGELHPSKLLVMDPRGAQVALPGEHTTEPTFGLPATWVDRSLKEEASFRGYTVVDPATVITTHLTEVLKDHMPDLLSYAETQKLLDDLPKAEQKLLDDLVPSQISISLVQRVLQGLLAERVSIRDLSTILEGIAEATGYTQNVTMMVEHVRSRLARQISHTNTNADGYIPLIALSAEWEQNFAEALSGQGEEKQLSMAPTKLQAFIDTVRAQFEEAALNGEQPVLLTSPAIRPYVRSIVERFRPATIVMSQNEIHPKARIRTVGQI